MLTSTLFGVLALAISAVSAAPAPQAPDATTDYNPEEKNGGCPGNQVLLFGNACYDKCPAGRRRISGTPECQIVCGPNQVVLFGNVCYNKCEETEKFDNRHVDGKDIAVCVCDLEKSELLFGSTCTLKCPVGEERVPNETGCRKVCPEGQELLFGTTCFARCSASQKRENFVQEDGSTSARCVCPAGEEPQKGNESRCIPTCAADETRVFGDRCAKTCQDYHDFIPGTTECYPLNTEPQRPDGTCYGRMVKLFGDRCAHPCPGSEDPKGDDYIPNTGTCKPEFA